MAQDDRRLRDLHNHGVSAFALAQDLEQTPEGRSTFVAYTVGAFARRLGVEESELSKWLQSAYSSLWVKHSNLNCGLDMKDVRRLVFKTYRKDRSV